jgi:hypothetical protein
LIMKRGKLPLGTSTGRSSRCLTLSPPTRPSTRSLKRA